MPSEMGFCQFFHGFQPNFHGRTNDFPHTPIDDSVEHKTFVDIVRAEMTIAVADRATTAAPYSASYARPVAHTDLSAAGAELAQIWRTDTDLCDPYRPELHYMRGPGPKWREKHANASPPSALAHIHAQSLVARNGVALKESRRLAESPQRNFSGAEWIGARRPSLRLRIP